jgi:hypothetical protein
VVERALLRGPLNGAVHAVDAELSLGELLSAYAQSLGQPIKTTQVSWTDVARRGLDEAFLWLVSSARFGQHYSQRRLFRELGYASGLPLESAVSAGIYGLQGQNRGLF